MPAEPAPIDHELFDVEERPARPVRGQLRPAPDWGSDDLFDAVPRRRFAPSDPGPRTAAAAAPAAASRPRLVPLEPIEEELASVELASVTALEPRGERRAGEDRRTITITGRPGEPTGMVRRERSAPTRRPTSGIHALAARPDRIMGWACALGVLLIAIALLT